MQVTWAKPVPVPKSKINGPEPLWAKPGKPFADLAGTPEELVKRAIQCLNQGDTAGFYRLSVDRAEYKTLYRFLPNADTSNDDDLDFRMGYFLMDNRKMALREFQNNGHAGLTFSRIAFLEGKEDRGRFAFHHGFHAWVKHGGIEVEFPISKSLISIDGGWKFWGFTDS